MKPRPWWLDISFWCQQRPILRTRVSSVPGLGLSQNSTLPTPTCCPPAPPLLSLLDQGTRRSQAAGGHWLLRTERAWDFPTGTAGAYCPWLGPAAHPQIAGNSSKIILLTIVRVHEHAHCWGLSHAIPPSASAWTHHHCTSQRKSRGSER